MQSPVGRLQRLIGISAFWVGLSVLGDAFITLVVAQRVAALAPPAQLATAIGLVGFVGLLAGMLVQPVAGAISDRLRPTWGRVGQVLAATGLVLLGLVAFKNADSLLAVAATFVLIQVAASIGQAAQQGFIPDLVDRDWRGRAAGLKGFADLGGAFLGFVLLAALLGPDLGPALGAVAAVLVLSAVVTVLLVREPRWRAPATAAAQPAAGRPALPGAFARVIAARFVFLLGTFVVGRFFLLFVADRRGVGIGQASAETAGLLAVLTLITALAAVPSGWLADRFRRGSIMVAGALLGALGAGLLLTADSTASILAFGGLMAVGSAAFASSNWAMATDLARPGEAGRMMGIANVGTAGAAAVAGLFGLFIDVTRPTVPGLGYGGMFVLATALFLLSAAVAGPLRRVNDGRYEPPGGSLAESRGGTMPEAFHQGSIAQEAREP